MITLAQVSAAVRLGQDGGHLLGVEVGDRPARRPLDGDAEYFCTLGSCERLAVGDEDKEAPESRQPTVAGRDRPVSILLDVLEEGEDFRGREVSEGESGDLAPPPLGDQAEEQPPGVAVGVHGMRRSVPLTDQPFLKEGLQQARQ